HHVGRVAAQELRGSEDQGVRHGERALGPARRADAREAPVTAVAQLHAPVDLVACAWVRSMPGLVCDGVASQLPADETKWAKNGFIVIPTGVGGAPQDR